MIPNVVGWQACPKSPDLVAISAPDMRLLNCVTDLIQAGYADYLRGFCGEGADVSVIA